jgi:hypothetical protein
MMRTAAAASPAFPAPVSRTRIQIMAEYYVAAQAAGLQKDPAAQNFYDSISALR